MSIWINTPIDRPMAPALQTGAEDTKNRKPRGRVNERMSLKPKELGWRPAHFSESSSQP
jgi:hypothetical protein